MAFRILNQDPQFFSADGKSLLVGGTVTFYASGTSTLQNTFTDPSLATPNNNPLTINSQGRIADVWGNANYRMVVADVLGSIQWTRDNVQGPFILPAQAGKAGDFLSTDGTALAWTAIIQPPSVTGQSGKLLSNDGASMFWQPAATLPTLPIIVATDSVKFGNTTGVAWLIQKGSSVGTASGTTTITKSIAFATAFAGVPSVSITVLTAYSGGPVVSYLGSAPTATGFSVTFDVAEGNPVNANMNSDVPFSWIAQGTVGA
jgi:hypothetical protein